MRPGSRNNVAWWALVLGGLLLATGPTTPLKADDFKAIFDGKSLDGWDGNPEFWRVEDGTITGQTTAENPTKGNTFLIWRGGEVGDFELKLEYKIMNHNSGVQYRSFEVPDNKWVVGGYQADIEGGDTYSGINYGERFGGILANRGQKTVVTAGEKGKAKVEVVETIGDSKEIQSKIKKQDWNEYHIKAKGFTFEHRINGVLTSVCTDERPEHRASGILALQLHAGPPMQVQFRNIQLKQLKAESAQAPSQSGGTKKIAFVAGRPSHGYGAHEHRAGCMLLAKALQESGLPVRCEVYTNGWAKGEDGKDLAEWPALHDADTIVIYADGGGGHPFNAHLEELNKLMKKGIGMVCIHYGVEVPKGPSGDAFLEWTGGYFEPNWSVNPHWDASYQKFPNHPITRGVKPFTINDEWYYHMRFRSGMQGVTPILTALPPDSTLSRKDGPHSGNPDVRAAIARGEPQHMAWAREREDGGRGFGFTGGHDHWNWGDNNFRKLVLNAIAWTAHLEVPSDGVPSKPLTVDDLMANQDYPVPANFNPTAIQAMLDKWNATK
jgi:type 1 glutamine amidotransferase